MRKVYLDNGATSYPKAPGVGEAMAHLDYLEVRGWVCRREIRGKRVYFAGAGDKI